MAKKLPIQNIHIRPLTVGSYLHYSTPYTVMIVDKDGNVYSDPNLKYTSSTRTLSISGSQEFDAIDSTLAPSPVSGKCFLYLDEDDGLFKLSVNGADYTSVLAVQTTNLQDGDVVVYSSSSHFSSTFSPFRWNSTNYNSAGFGGSGPSALYFVSGPSVTEVTADNTTVSFAIASDLHIGLLSIGSLHQTLIIDDSLGVSTGADLEALLQAQVDPSYTCDNFKAHAFTQHTDASFTWNGFTGFEQAGAVTVISGGTTPPAITFTQDFQGWVNGSNYSPKHFGCGIYINDVPGGGDTAQTISNNSETTINIDTNNLFHVTGWHTDSNDHSFAHEGGYSNMSAIGVLTVLDDSGAIIPSAVLKVQYSAPGPTWITLASGLGGSLSFPMVYDGTNLQMRATIKQTSGGDVNIYARVDIIYQD